MKQTSLFVLLLLITLLGTGAASFAACSATSLTAGSGVWGAEAYGTDSSGNLDNILMQVTFVSGGTFSGTEWQSIAGTITGPTAISGTWSQVTPATDCQGTFKVTSPSTQTFNFAINNANKGGSLVQTDASYTIAGFMVAQASTLTCSATTLKSKEFSLYSNGTIPAAGGLVTGTGEIKFASTGTTFSAVPSVSLDLGAVGHFTAPANGTATVVAGCTGTGSLTVPALSQTFDVDLVIVGTGNEALWIVTNSGDNVTGYFLE